jgi:hypothetical protein
MQKQWIVDSFPIHSIQECDYKRNMLVLYADHSRIIMGCGDSFTALCYCKWKSYQEPRTEWYEIMVINLASEV